MNELSTLVRASTSIDDAAAALRSGAITSTMLTEHVLDRIDKFDSLVHAFVHVDRSGALSAASEADAAFREGVDLGPMQGVPYALKDIYDAKGLPTTCNSRLRLDHVANEDSEVCRRFRAAGGVLLGKLATFEFALGGPSFDLPFPPTRNPWNLNHVAGGSSSGSGAAIAAGYMAVAPGTCTTGSIRGPAAWCGAVGLKPTFGRVSRTGVFPLSPSLDHCGPLTRSVRDAAISLQIMAGYDASDSASIDVPVPNYCAGLDDSVAGLKIGVPRAFFETEPKFSFSMRDGLERSLRGFEVLGCQVDDVLLPPLELFTAVGRVMMTAEAYAVHRRDLQDRLLDYGEIAARRFAIGAAITDSDLRTAKNLQAKLSRAVDASLEQCDVLVTIIALQTAPLLTPETKPAAWPLQASAFNVTGHPAISLPIGLSEDGLPLAIQIVGRPFDEAKLLTLGQALERVTNWLNLPLPNL